MGGTLISLNFANTSWGICRTSEYQLKGTRMQSWNCNAISHIILLWTDSLSCHRVRTERIERNPHHKLLLLHHDKTQTTVSAYLLPLEKIEAGVTDLEVITLHVALLHRRVEYVLLRVGDCEVLGETSPVEFVYSLVCLDLESWVKILVEMSAVEDCNIAFKVLCFHYGYYPYGNKKPKT